MNSDEMTQDTVENSKIKSKKFLLIAGAIAAVLIAVLLFAVIMPNINLNNAKESFEAKDYAAAAEYYKKSGRENDPENVKQYRYALAFSQFEQGKYAEAADNFKKTKGLLDSESKIFACGVALVEAKEYNAADKCFEMVETEDSVTYGNFCKAAIAYNNKNYAEALEYLEPLESKLEIAKELLPEVHFAYAVLLFDSAEYLDAMTQFKAAGNYSETDSYISACTLMAAEEQIANGDLGKAKTALESLPEDFSYEGITVAERLETLNNLNGFVEICGKWSASKNYIESRNVYKSNGSWDSWYFDQTATNQILELFCNLNDDGTVTIVGEVSFYKFSDYSSLKEYCNATITSRSFTIKNVTEIPSSYKIDENTTLKYSNGVFSIEYSVKDNYSAHFYNLYRSNVTYGTKL